MALHVAPKRPLPAVAPNRRRKKRAPDQNDRGYECHPSVHAIFSLQVGTCASDSLRTLCDFSNSLSISRRTIAQASSSRSRSASPGSACCRRSWISCAAGVKPLVRADRMASASSTNSTEFIDRGAIIQRTLAGGNRAFVLRGVTAFCGIVFSRADLSAGRKRHEKTAHPVSSVSPLRIPFTGRATLYLLYFQRKSGHSNQSPRSALAIFEIEGVRSPRPPFPYAHPAVTR
jgi:hypothetical protein